MRSLFEDVILDAAPVVAWEFQEESGNVQDISGNGRHMDSVAGTPDYRQVGPMNDFSVRCVGGEVLTRSNEVSTVTDNFTLELLFEVQAVGSNNQGVFYNGNGAANGWGIVIDTNGQIQGIAGGVAFLANYTGLNFIGAGFQLLHVYRDAGTWKYALNGAEVVANAGTNAPATPDGTMFLGAASVQCAYAHAAIYETVLTQAQREAAYAAMKSTVRTGAIAFTT